jgi:hypothetical protein
MENMGRKLDYHLLFTPLHLGKGSSSDYPKQAQKLGKTSAMVVTKLPRPSSVARIPRSSSAYVHICP